MILGEEGRVHVVGRGDVEGALFFLRHEGGLGHEQALGFVEDALGRFQQALAMLGRHHAARRVPAAIAGQFGACAAEAEIEAAAGSASGPRARHSFRRAGGKGCG
jgi:hypothetical protein